MAMKKTKIKSANKTISRNRLLVVLIVMLLIFVILATRVLYIQLTKGAEYRVITSKQSTSSTIISAKRGTIYDKNNKALAISADVDTISVNPSYLVIRKGNDIDENKTKEMKHNLAKKMTEIFGTDEDEIYKKLTSNKSVETLVTKVEQDKVDLLNAWLKENNITAGINIDKDSKRYYPFNNLASNVIGFCGTSNQGLDGIELSYNDVLSGTTGRLTTSISSVKSIIPDSDEEYVAPQNGSNIYLTIDSNIQTIVEKYLKQAVEENGCTRGGNCIIMDPTNGDILAMATYPDYNLNDPYTPNASLKATWDSLSTEEQTNQLYGMWRNRAVLDTYEPGSTFKTITSSIALEENLVETDTAGDFYCNGSYQVAGHPIACTGYHGSQTLRRGLMNSCNPAFMQLGQRIGVGTFYKYLRAFGFFEKTGIDLPSEGTSSFWAQENCGPVELATMSFGQRFTITPMQLVRAVSCIVNGGELVTPHVVGKIENTETGTITTVEGETTRQVISEETANKVRDMMHDVVASGGGRNAQVQGYEIGGKTGTSEPNPAHPENGYVASFLAIAPVEDSKLVCLLTLYHPTKNSIFGGKIAAPAVSQILTEVLPYLEIPSTKTQTTAKETKQTVPNLKGLSKTEANKKLTSLGLDCITLCEGDEIITEQNPRAGTQLVKGGKVRLYSKEHSEPVMTTVPNLKGVSYEQAKNMLMSKNLNISSTGSGIVIAQDPTASTSVEEGSIVSIILQNKTNDNQN